MNTHEKRSKVIFYIAVAVAVVSLAAVVVLDAVQVYVRWNVNQNFTFLGGSELEVLTACAFGLLAILAYLYRVAP